MNLIVRPSENQFSGIWDGSGTINLGNGAEQITPTADEVESQYRHWHGFGSIGREYARERRAAAAANGGANGGGNGAT